jgi:hypothetical protein
MDIDPIVFSSKHACDRVAERTVREFGMERTNVLHTILLQFMPAFKQIITKHKMVRGDLKMLTRKYREVMAANPAVINMEIDTINGPLSTKESYDARAIFMQADDNDQFLDLMGSQAFLTRKDIVIDVASADFKVHRHVLSRYMQRERKGPDQFMTDLMKAVHVSYVLVAALARSRSDFNIALPINDALLLGEYKLHRGYGEKVQLSVSPFGGEAPHAVPREQPSLIKNCHAPVRMMTYVDGDSMLSSREELHGMLTEFYQKYEFMLRNSFDACVHSMKIATPEMVEAYVSIRSEANDAAMKLVNSRVWDYYARSVQTG